MPVAYPLCAHGMPKFYFDVHDDVDVEDEEGVILPDEGAARSFALNAVRELACDELRHGRLNLKHLIAVKDENGRALFTVSFGEVVEIDS